jgi:hypothetical protein
MAFSQSWLEDTTSIKGIFAEVTVYDVVATSNIVLYLSSIGYLTEDAAVSYNPIIIGGVKVTESLSMDGAAGLSFGDLEISNPNGDLDSWLDNTKYIWVNKPIVIYLGDPFWATNNLAQLHTDFLKIFDGVIENIDSRDRTKLNIKVRDKLERLNTPLTENKLGTYGVWGASAQTNQDTILPIVFGEVHNVTPMLINPAALEYQFNDGNAELLIEIRDNGIPIYNSLIPTGATVTHTTGKFTLTKPLVGACTVSMQGVKNSINLTTGALVSGTYANNIANLIALITTQYGNSASKLNGTTELDLVNLANFAANTQAVGAPILDRTNVLIICQDLARSIGAQVFMSRVGKLQLLQLGVPISTAIVPLVNITNDNILHHTLQISAMTDVVAATKLGFCKNYTVQAGLLSSIPVAHKDLYATEWLTRTVTDTSVKALYTLDAEPIQKDTALLVGTEALAEATRLNNFYKIPRFIYTFTGTAGLLSLQLGQAITLTHNRFNLDAGKSGQVISLAPNWLASTIEVGVLI